MSLFAVPGSEIPLNFFQGALSYSPVTASNTIDAPYGLMGFTGSNQLDLRSNVRLQGALINRSNVQLIDPADGLIWASNIKPDISSLAYAQSVNALAALASNVAYGSSNLALSAYILAGTACNIAVTGCNIAIKGSNLAVSVGGLASNANNIAIAAEATAAAALAAVAALALADKFRDLFHGPPVGYNPLSDIEDPISQYDDNQAEAASNAVDWYMLSRRPFVTSAGTRRVGVTGDLLIDRNLRLQTFNSNECVRTNWGCNLRWPTGGPTTGVTAIDFKSNTSYLNVACSNVRTSGDVTVGGNLYVTGMVNLNGGAVRLMPDGSVWVNERYTIEPDGHYYNFVYDSQIQQTAFAEDIDDLLGGTVALRTFQEANTLIDTLPYAAETDLDPFFQLAKEARFDPNLRFGSFAFQDVPF